MMTNRRKPLLGFSLLAGCAVAAFAHADSVVIEKQDFNSLATGTYTVDSLPDGGALTNSGSMNIGGDGLEFMSYWFDTRDEEAGPVTVTSDTSDYIGVNSYAGSNAPNVSSAGVSVSSGVEHNFEFNDTDGRIDLVFEAVDLSGYEDRSAQFSYWITDTGYESGDTLYFTISDGTNALTFLNYGDAELEANVSADDGSANWKTAFVYLEDLFELGFSETITLTISVDTNASSENIYVDDILFQSGAELPGDGEDETYVRAAIYEIQGASHTSPLVGEQVITIGVVTAVDSNGYYLQDVDGDGDDATSDAVLVYTGRAPTVVVGDRIQLQGTVTEYTAGGSSSGNLSITELVSTTILTQISGSVVPSPVLIGEGGRVPPTESIDDDAFTSFEPESDGEDFFESLEGMLVTAQDLVAIAGSNSYYEIFAVVDGGASASGMSERGTLNIAADDFNPERIQIDTDTGILPGFYAPVVNTGALLGDVTGIMSYSYGNYEIVPTIAFEASEVGVADDAATFPGKMKKRKKDELLIATYNVLNLDPNDEDGDTDLSDGRFEMIAEDIVVNLKSPDVVGLQEIQDGSGSTNDGTVSAELTLQALVEAIEDAGGPSYEFIDNTFIGDGTNGGQPGANIRTAFLYDPRRVKVDDDAITSILADDQQTNEENPFYGSRLPLVVPFEFNRETVLVINNHFSSKGGSAPLFGVDQPFDALQEDPKVNGGVDERKIQATAVAAYVERLLEERSGAKVIVLGDLNEFEFVSPVSEILGSVLSNLILTLPENERYSYIYEGNSQSIDHILVSDALLKDAAIDIVHLNSEYDETGIRASDHDPVVAKITVKKGHPQKKEICAKLNKLLSEKLGKDHFVYKFLKALFQW